MGAGPAHAAHFGMYEFIREISGGRGDGWGAVAGTGGIFFPLDVDDGLMRGSFGWRVGYCLF